MALSRALEAGRPGQPPEVSPMPRSGIVFDPPKPFSGPTDSVGSPNFAVISENSLRRVMTRAGEQAACEPLDEIPPPPPEPIPFSLSAADWSAWERQRDLYKNFKAARARSDEDLHGVH